MAANPKAEVFLNEFEAAYAALFSRTVAGLEVEIAIWTATTRATVGYFSKPCILMPDGADIEIFYAAITERETTLNERGPSDGSLRMETETIFETFPRQPPNIAF